MFQKSTKHPIRSNSSKCHQQSGSPTRQWKGSSTTTTRRLGRQCGNCLQELGRHIPTSLHTTLRVARQLAKVHQQQMRASEAVLSVQLQQAGLMMILLLTFDTRKKRIRSSARSGRNGTLSTAIGIRARPRPGRQLQLVQLRQTTSNPTAGPRLEELAPKAVPLEQTPLRTHRTQVHKTTSSRSRPTRTCHLLAVLHHQSWTLASRIRQCTLSRVRFSRRWNPWLRRGLQLLNAKRP
mmetsp:Transcript_57716/g.137341  ORF Transcript_57716/g.137341 Transcript_57716/m.137341 type:complete len:237 (-) Transcript_57716:304-1014(-)